jgi:hypothetical protein
MSPSQQGSVTPNRLWIEATKLAQRQAISRKMLDLLVDPAAQAPHRQAVRSVS